MKRCLLPILTGAVAIIVACNQHVEETSSAPAQRSASGKPVRDAPRRAAESLRLFPFCEAGKWGYMNAEGEVVIQPQFAWAEDFSEGRARASSPKGEGYIDEHGRLVFILPGDCSTRRRFSDGRVAFSAENRSGFEGWGFLDSQGNIVVEPKYPRANDFSEGVAWVNVGARPLYSDVPVGGRWGLIDKSGQVVVKPDFASVNDFSEGLAAVHLHGGFMYFDRAKKTVVRTSRLPEEPPKGVERRQAFGGHAYVDKTGQTVFKLDYKFVDPKRVVFFARSFREGLAFVLTSAHGGPFAGFINKTGTFAILPQFDYASDFSEGLAYVRVGKKAAYIDRTGAVVLEAPSLRAGDFSSGLAAVKISESYGYIDKQGNFVIDPRDHQGRPGPLNAVEAFSGPLARVHIGGEFVQTIGPSSRSSWKGGTWYYINRKGEIIRRIRRDEEAGPGYGGESR